MGQDYSWAVVPVSPSMSAVYNISMPATRLTFRRTECDTATDIGYMREDGAYAAVRIFDWSDVETISGQLRVLAEQITRAPATFDGRFNARRKN